MLRLNDKHAPRIESFVTLAAAVKVVHLETGDDAEGVFFLVGADLVHSGRDGECFEGLVVEAFVEVDELGDESHVGVNAATTLLAIVETVLERHAPR